MTLLILAFEFFKAGLFAIGGGLATLPYLMEMAVNHPTWFSIDELMNMIAVSESTPGPIGVNMSSYVGYHVAGLPGAVIATFSLVLPAYLSILIVVRILDRFRTNRRISGGLEGLRPAVTGLIAAAGYSVLSSSLFRVIGGVTQFQWLAFLLFLCFFTVMQLRPLQKVHPLLYIAFGAVLGVVLQL
ncbi:MAG: chromate transporter [Eubacteriales bacterium]|nr:chromate transporter [Eubacteriales bacterium]